MQAALFTALTAVGALISVPLPFTPVPATLATLAALLSGALLGPKYGVLSQLVYLLLGAAGAPVFHNFTGGAGIIIGPTGGFIFGYIALALITGLVLKKTDCSTTSIILAGTAGTLTCYFTGTLWFMISTGTGFTAAIASCILPFIAGDILKIIAAVFLIKRLRPII